MNNETEFDPTGCQSAMGIRQLDYIADQVDAQKRLKQGQNQTFCKTCDRWRWLDQRCPEFSLDKK